MTDPGIHTNSIKTTELLSIKDLTVDFNTMDGVVNAIDGINLTIHKGEVVAIVGESGSGKSVTSMSILQLHPSAITKYTRGSILYQGQNKEAIDLLKCPTKALQVIRGNSIAMIFQEPMTSLNPVMRCGSQVMEALIQHKKISKQAAIQKTLQLFSDVQIPEPEKAMQKYPHELSGGQKQRVMIAMAMCCNPELLICDEPTTALDVTVQKSVLELIKQLQLQNNMSVLFISHDLGLVSAIADTIVVMYKGKIVEQGTAQQILTNPQHHYTKALLACRPALYPKGTRLPVVADFLDGKMDSKTITTSTEQPATASLSNTPTLNEQKIISIQKVTVSYPIQRNLLGKVTKSFTAVDNVSLDIYKGETLGLVGESGCGKTTLGRAILQLQKPTQGQIIYANKNIATLQKKETADYRKEVQIIFQDPYSSLNPRLTIGSAILEPMLVNNMVTNKRTGKEAVMDLLNKVELKPEHFHRYPHEFSGGQRQRIVIARALALQPKFVVCDESVSALDVSVQAQILNLLNDLKKQFGFTTLFISHDLSVVHYISDRIAVMQKGRIVEINTASEIFYHAKADYTQKLIQAIPGKIYV
jgi:peptide/nickel transport system ATP-binding protein